LAAEARELGLPALEARAFFLRSVIDFHLGDQHGAIASSLARLEATRFATPRELGLELAGTARCFLMVQRDIAAAERLILQARNLLGDGDELDLFWSRGLLAETQGDLEAAADLLERALLSTRRLDGHFEQCECLCQLTLVEFDRGQYERALARAEELVDVSSKLGESGFHPFARSALQLTHAALASEREGGVALAGLLAVLPALRALDANRLLAQVLIRAARLELGQGAIPSRAAAARAQPFAEEALAAASRAERLNERVEARALLATIARASDQPEILRCQLAALEADAASLDLLARNSGLIARVRSLLP
jgi:tetratricopeptide (TPR) repeat protein